jgi:hypothetical protein
VIGSNKHYTLSQYINNWDSKKYSTEPRLLIKHKVFLYKKTKNISKYYLLQSLLFPLQTFCSKSASPHHLITLFHELICVAFLSKLIPPWIVILSIVTELIFPVSSLFPYHFMWKLRLEKDD